MPLIHPCPNCHTNELFFIGVLNNRFCPYCDIDKIGYYIISKVDTEEILHSWARSFEQVIETAIQNNFEKYSLLYFLITSFDSSIFTMKTPLVPIMEWLAVITLLNWVNKMPIWICNPGIDQNGQFHWAKITTQKVSKLANLVMQYNLVRQWSIYCTEEYDWGSLFTKKEDIDIIKLKELSKNLLDGKFSELIRNFDLVWLNKLALKTVIEPSLAEKGIAPRSSAVKKYLARKKEYEEAVQTAHIHPENLYTFLKEGGLSFSMFTSSLLQNKLWNEILDIDCDLDENDLNSLFKFYFENLNGKLMLKKAEFMDLIREYNINQKLLDNTLLSEENPNALPLFIQVADSHVIYSLRNYYFLFMYLIARSKTGQEFLQQSFTKDGELFEKNIVPKLFKDRLKMNTIDLKTKKLEIDLIAYNTNVIFVIEAKRWDFKPFLTLRKKLEEVVRDLKGIVDGIKYSTRKGKLLAKEKPSLQEKVKYIEQNRKNLSLPDIQVIGLVITRLYPPFRLYKDCFFLSYEEVSDARLKEIMDVKEIVLKERP